jgi:hypothetical protein
MDRDRLLRQQEVAPRENPRQDGSRVSPSEASGQFKARTLVYARLTRPRSQQTTRT